MKTFLYAILLTILSILPAAAQQHPTPLYGVMCETEEASIKIAMAYDEGGPDLGDEVTDHLINVEMVCGRWAPEDALLGYVVYRGPVFGTNQVLGVAPDPTEKPRLYGVVDVIPPLPPKQGA